MGNIREWSDIFDLLYGGEFFSAVIYDDEKECCEDMRTYNSQDWADDKKAYSKAVDKYDAREKAYSKAVDKYDAREKEYSHIIYSDKLYSIGEEIVIKDGVNYIKYEDFLPYKPFWKYMPDTGFLMKKTINEDFWTGFENEKSSFKEEEIKNYFESGQSGIVKSVDSIEFVGKSKIDKILNASTDMFAHRSGNVKIEVTNNNTVEKESDIESITDRLTERLYEMMSRGADGLY